MVAETLGMVLLPDPAVLHEHDPIGPQDHRRPMADHHGGLALALVQVVWLGDGRLLIHLV